MFEPKYIITSKMLYGLMDLESAKTVVDLVPISGEWDMKLKKEALTKKIYYGLHFVGVELSSTDIAKIISYDPGRDEKAGEVAERAGVLGKEIDIQLVLNWLNASRFKDQLAYLEIKFKQSSFSEKDLMQINSLLLEKTVQSQRLGIYRMADTVSETGNKLTTIPAVEVTYQMEDFFRWFVSTKDEMPPVIKTGVCLYELLRICPFEDGNLLSAIIFCSLILDSSGYSFKQLWAFEEALLKNREVFWMYLSSPDKKSGELSEWLEYFVKCLGQVSLETKSKLMMLIGETPAFRSESGRVMPLTERQIAIMEDLTLRGETTIKEIRSILPIVSDDTILRDLKDLIEKKLIRKKGKTKGAAYVLGKTRNFRR